MGRQIDGRMDKPTENQLIELPGFYPAANNIQKIQIAFVQKLKSTIPLKPKVTEIYPWRKNGQDTQGSNY